MHGCDLSDPRLEGWITLTTLAQATRRLRLGTLVTGIHYRHPAVLANMAATLDIVSAGRHRFRDRLPAAAAHPAVLEPLATALSQLS